MYIDIHVHANAWSEKGFNLDKVSEWMDDHHVRRCIIQQFRINHMFRGHTIRHNNSSHKWVFMYSMGSIASPCTSVKQPTYAILAFSTRSRVDLLVTFLVTQCAA